MICLVPDVETYDVYITYEYNVYVYVNIYIYISWEPKTFIFRGYNPYNLHVSWFWGPRVYTMSINNLYVYTYITNININIC